MLNIYCWRCGTKISEEDILGIGHFDQDIGKYSGKGFVSFHCPRCKKVHHQILEDNYNGFYSYDNYPGHGIDLDQVIDFHRVLQQVNTVDSFLEKCKESSDAIRTEMKKPILQPLDVYQLFYELNQANMKRLMVLTLDKDNYLLNWEFLGEGSNKPVSFEPKAIFHTSFLLEEKAAVIIAHNLNSHFTQPTQKDILMTRRLIKAGKVLGVDFLDHIVIEENGFHSYDQLNYI